jgi:ATP-dependent DNA helicase RecG
MDNAELEALLLDVEADRVERKASLANSDRIREAICAFANDLPDHREPGVVFIGANDDGSCTALPITDQLLLTLADMRSDGNIVPFPSLTVQKRTLGNCEMAVVIVQPADAPPVRFQGRVWIRVGPRRAIATLEDERRLTEKRRARDLPFDMQPVRAATILDFDLDLFLRSYLPASVAPEVIAENRRSIEQQLASLRLVMSGAVEPIPTVVGVLVLAKDPLQFIPGAYVQFLRIDGEKLTDPVRDGVALAGPLPELLQALEQKLEAHIETARDFTSGSVEVIRPDYPMVALQQLTRNAILHRSYEGTNAPVRINWFSDRIEILNPGGPFGQVNRGNFGMPGITDYRNSYLAEAMRNLGYVQKFGIGISLAKSELEKNGNPPIEFQVEDSYVLAIVRKHV